MPKTYAITRRDAAAAWMYLHRKLATGEFPAAKTEAAKRAFPSDGTAKVVQAWCDNYLSAQEWQRLRAAVRQEHSRYARIDEKRKTITISNKAWEYASWVAEREECTLSEAMEKHMYRVWRRPGKATKKKRR